MSSSNLMLSISGLRGLIGDSLTPVVAARYASAVGSWLADSSRVASPHIVVGRDSRPSGDMIERAAVAGLIAVGCRVTTIGIATTPGVAIMVEHLNANGGMVITASHNPIIWNGIKTLRHDGVAPPPDQSRQIIDRFHNNDFTYTTVDNLLPVAYDDSTNQIHVDRVLKNIDTEIIRSLKPSVVLDSVHGAGGPAGAMLLNALGVNLIHDYAEPSGQFPDSPEPTAENLIRLSESVKQNNAQIGFAQDPDADRLAIVDENGTYIGEEYTLALATHRILQRSSGPVAANLSTSRMLDDIAQSAGAPVHRTPVGEAHVADTMRKQNCVIGGEGNGGVIWPPVIHVRDSLGAMAIILELMATTGKPLSQLVADLPSYAIVKDKLPIQEGMAEAAIQKLKSSFASEQIDLQDGIRIDFSDKRWVHLRPSNTEPILRIIAEAPDQDLAAQLVAEVRRSI